MLSNTRVSPLPAVFVLLYDLEVIVTVKISTSFFAYKFFAVSGSCIARDDPSSSIGLLAPPAQEMNVAFNSRKERSNAQKIVHFKINLYPPPITLCTDIVNTREGLFVKIYC